jgi:hypothetical protein
MQMFGAGVEYWTLLFLLPHRMKRGTHHWPDIEELDGKPMMMAMLVGISWCLEWASHSWATVADRFEELLVPVDADILPKDDHYEQSHTCLWILSNIEEFEPMILDAIEQWVSFATKHKLDDEMQEFPLGKLKMPDLGEFVHRWRNSPEGRREDMIVKIRDIEIHKKKLEDSLRRLRALRKQAKTVRDGV